jgi:hypothetical protein
MSLILRALAAVGLCFVLAAAWMAIQLVAGGGSTTGQMAVVEYKDFVTILLTALAVMIAVGTIMAAFAAIYGFDLLRKELVKASAETAAKVAAEQAEKIARARVDELVPGLVDQTVRFEREVPAEAANEIAKEFGKEGGE